MRTFITFLLFFVFLVAYGQPGSHYFQKLYGDQNPNYFGKVVIHNNFYYVLGGRTATEFPTVSKIDNLGNIVWTKEIAGNGKWEDMIINSDGNILCVGWRGQADNANQSMIGVVDNITGNFISLKIYNFNQSREFLLNIYLNPVPAASLSPYYIFGLEGDPLTDNVNLTTVDKDGNIGFRKIINVNTRDNEFARNVTIDGRTGQMMIVGNGAVTVPTNRAITVTLDNNANVLSTRLFDYSGVFLGILTKTNPIAGFNHILGGSNLTDGTARLTKVDGPSVLFSYRIPQLSRISSLTPGSNSGEFLAIGHGVFNGLNRPVIISYTDNGSSVTQNWAKILDDSESAYDFGHIKLDLVNSRYAYVDGRTNNADGFGQMDAFLSVDNLTLDNCLDISVQLSLESVNTSFEAFQPITSNGNGANPSNLTGQDRPLDMVDICGCEKIPPVIDCPDDVTLKCGEFITATNTGTATATDNSGLPVTIVSSLGVTTVSGCIGTTFQTFEATDACGNTNTCIQKITTIHDFTPPFIENCGRKVILNGIVDANGNCGREVVVVAPDVFDNCQGQILITNNYISGEDASGYYPSGTTYVTFTATDACGNSNTCQDTIIILPCGKCEGLSATLDPVTDSNGKCCYALNINNSQGPGSVDGICFDMITADWIMNTVTLATGYTFTAGSTSGDFACIENASGIPLGYSTVATICMAELSPMANDTQCIQISWMNNLQSLGCLDTLKTFCRSPVKKDTCFAITNMVIECDPNDDYSYCVSMKITNLGPNGMAYFKLDALPSGFIYDDCPGCTGTQGDPYGSGGQWYFNMGLLPTNGMRTVCFKIKSTSPILSPTPIYTLGNAEGLNWCCHSPKPICFLLNPCCDPCEDISLTLTPLQNQDTCCYRLDLKSECDYKVFDKIELDLLTAGVEISSFAVLNSAWTPIVKSPGHKICFAPNSGFITSANDGALVNFCISGVDNPSEMPQYLNINYYSKDSILCDTLLILECEDKDSECVVVTDEKVECDTVNKKYIFTMTVDNNSNPAFTATDFVVFPMTGGSIVPTPIPFSPPLSATGAPQTVTFCYVPTTFPDPLGYVVFVYKLIDADGHCCEGGEIFYDTIPLPMCVDSCFFLQCAKTKYVFDVDSSPLGPVTNMANFGVFPYQNFPTVVKDGCNGSSNSVQLRGVTRGYAGEAIGVKRGGIAGLDTLGKKGDECCLTFCHKMKQGKVATTAMLEVYVNGFLPGQTQLLGYYPYTNDIAWDETQILFVHPFNVKEIVFRNITSDPLDVPPSIFIDDIRLGMAMRVKDEVAPVITCPSDVSVTGSGTPCVYNYVMPTISATDNSGHFSMTCTINGSPAIATSIYPLSVGTHTIQCIAIDSCENADTCVYKIFVGCNNDTLCTCPSKETSFTLLSNGIKYPIICGDENGTPKLECPPSDVQITGSFACQNINSQEPCNNTVAFSLDRPGLLSTLTGFGFSASVVLTFPASDISHPGMYTLTLTTVCPGSSDTCVCVLTWYQQECPVNPDCKCGGFNKTKFCILNTGTAVETECNLQNKVYNLPCPETSLVNYCGTFKCNPDTCSPPVVNFILTNTNIGATIHTASLSLNPLGKFTINLLPGWCNDPSLVYEIKVSGVCGNDTCVCITKFRVDCPQQSICKCDQKFNADVANGYSQTSVVGSCIRRFSPNNLCPNDRVDWYRNGTFISSTMGMASNTFGVGAGYGNVCMIVTRIENPDVICKDTFCSNTFCVPEGIKDCIDIDNGEMVNNIDGYIDDDGTMTNWTKDEGWPYAFANEGLSDGNIMLIASKDMPSAARTNRNGAPPKKGFLTFVLDVESYLSTPIPVGTTLELEGITATGQRTLISTFDVAGYRKGWDGTIKREISMPEEIYSVVLRLSTTSTEPVLLRIDNFCLYSTVETNDTQMKNQFSVYPNPTTGQLTIQFTSAIDQDYRLRVLDLLGRVVSNGYVQKGNNSYNLSIEDKAGIYIIQLEDSTGNLSQRKVIKIE